MALFFYLFAAVTLVGGLGVVLCKNPVSSAFSMIASFLGMASLFILLNAYLAGIIQVLVYAGAIMVLFIFIIMLMDVKAEKARSINYTMVGAGTLLVFLFVMQLVGVLKNYAPGGAQLPSVIAAEKSDVHAIGNLMYTDYLFPVQVIGVLLLISTVGVVILSKKELK
jgi:NADH-quinone oxidoreductase subunit J